MPGTRVLYAPVIAFGILGVIGIWYPQLFGNGLDTDRDAFPGLSGLSLMLILFALKPLVCAAAMIGAARQAPLSASPSSSSPPTADSG